MSKIATLAGMKCHIPLSVLQILQAACALLMAALAGRCCRFEPIGLLSTETFIEEQGSIPGRRSLPVLVLADYVRRAPNPLSRAIGF